MKYGFVLPGGDAATVAARAVEAEDVGWDGLFVWEGVWGVDPWVSLAAAAVRTSTIRLGTLLTPLSRRRPWKVASETATLDNLSGGRVILATGLGAVDTGFATFGEVTDRRTRAELLDEALAIITGLWAGQPFRFEGKHYSVAETDFHVPPPPVQQPRIPIWVVGAIGRPRSMRRAVSYDGILPTAIEDGAHRPVTPEDLADVAAFAAAHRTSATPLDVVVEGETDPAGATDEVARWEEAGATWWVESRWDAIDDPEAVGRRIAAGPPR